MKYQEGYKFRLFETISFTTPIVGHEFMDDYFYLNESGILTAFKGYAWDGASGPVFNTKNSLSATLVHDIFCVLMRSGKLDYAAFNDTVHDFLGEMLRANGMSWIRSKAWVMAVKFARGGKPTDTLDNPVLEAL